MLIVMSGRSGAGKTTISRALARTMGAVHLRIDTIEQTLRDGGLQVEAEGYCVAYAVAEGNLRLGLTVIADSVNPWPLTRAAWRAVADRAGVPCVDVEIVCSDTDEHRRRVESRVADIANHRVPTWPEVVDRDYQPWTTACLVVDSAQLDVEESVRRIRDACAAYVSVPGTDSAR
jgi:predicted kinase